MKEMKSVPKLIYAVEQYERYLIQLTKKSKVLWRMRLIFLVRYPNELWSERKDHFIFNFTQCSRFL